MDFIYPYPEGSDMESILVPYYATPRYNHTAPEAFRNFAHRTGFTRAQGSTALATGLTPDNLAALMQSWLYFGVIDEILDEHTDRSAFFVSPEILEARQLTGDWIDVRIPALLDEKISASERSANKLKPKAQKARSNHVNQCLSHAFQRCLQFESIDVPTDSALVPVCLAVRLLLSHIERRFPLPFGVASPQSSIPAPLSTVVVSPLVQMLLERGRVSGTCMRTLYSNGTTFDHATIYYLTSLRRRSVANEHRTCTRSSCQVDDTPRKMLAAHHRTEGCQCSLRSPPLEDILKLIREGETPLISLTHDSLGCVDLKVVKSTGDTPYVAISHVWSDNQLCSHANGLYQCQLEWLVDAINGVPQASNHSVIRLWGQKKPKNRLFWLDTLCVPIGDEYVDIKQQAIDQMDLVYAGATKVLVLDRELQQMKVCKDEIIIPRRHRMTSSWWYELVQAPERNTLLMLGSYIFRSNWMSRAWTLQEGYLAHDCVLQLADGFAEIEHLNPRFYYSITHDRKKYTGLTTWFFVGRGFYTFLRRLFCRPDRITQRNIVFRVIDTVHAVFAMFLSLFINVLLWFFILLGHNFDREVEINRLGTLGTVDRSSEYDRLCESVCSEVRGAIVQLNASTSNSSHAQRFQQAWKALLSRSATETEDLHAILANLTGFSAREVLQYRYIGERMRKMLYMFPSLPLDILYLEGEKYSPDTESADTWMPIWPCDSALTSKSTIVFDNSGYVLSLEANDQLYVIKGDSINSCSFEALAWNASPTEDDGASGSVEVLDVKCLGTDEEVKASLTGEKEDSKHYLLIERIGDSTADRTNVERSIERGALLHLVKKKKDKHYLQYNCAVRIRRRFREMASTTCGRFIEKTTITCEPYLQKDCSKADRPNISRRSINPILELDQAKAVSTLIAVQLYVTAISLISVLAYGLRRRLPPHIEHYAPGYGVCVAMYLLFALCVILPVSQWATNVFLARVVFNAWKSSFSSGENRKVRLSFWDLLYHIYLGVRKILRAIGRKLHRRVIKVGGAILAVIVFLFAVFEVVIAPIMILGYMVRNTNRWVTHNTAPEVRVPLPTLQQGHCWSGNGQTCLYNGAVLHPVPAKPSNTSCWSWDGKECYEGSWDGDQRDAGPSGWWNGNTTQLLTWDGNGTLVTTIVNKD